MAWENLAILSSVRTFADPSTVALWLFLHFSSRCKSRYVFWWLLVSQRPQMCLLSASENGHTVNDILYPWANNSNVHMGLTYFVWKNNYDILWRGLYKHKHSLHAIFSFQLCLSLKFQQDLHLLCFFNLFILWVCPHSLSVLLAYGWSLLVAFILVA